MVGEREDLDLGGVTTIVLLNRGIEYFTHRERRGELELPAMVGSLSGSRSDKSKPRRSYPAVSQLLPHLANAGRFH